MKKITIVYNTALKDEIMDLMEQSGIKSYTRIENISGAGKSSGPHLGTNVWPGYNDLIMAVVDDSTKNIFMEKFKPLKASFLKEGLKAFVENVEEII